MSVLPHPHVSASRSSSSLTSSSKEHLKKRTLCGQHQVSNHRNATSKLYSFFFLVLIVTGIQTLATACMQTCTTFCFYLYTRGAKHMAPGPESDRQSLHSVQLDRLGKELRKKDINLGLLSVFSISLTAFPSDKDLLRNHS